MCPPSRSSLAAVLVALAALCPRSARAEAPPPAAPPVTSAQPIPAAPIPAAPVPDAHAAAAPMPATPAAPPPPATAAHAPDHAPEHGAAPSGGHDGAPAHGAAGAPAHEHHNRFFVGVNGVALAGLGGGSWEGKFGAGAFFEVGLVPNGLELEVGFHVLKVPHGVEVPIDVLLKVPFHVNKWFHPYVGVGPMVVPGVVTEEATGEKATVVEGGIASVIGGYFWVHPHVALSAEINNNAIFGGHGAKYEVGGTGGVVYGW